MDSLSRHEDYGSVPLNEMDMVADPIAQFAEWLKDAEEFPIYEPNAMVLGTIDDDGKPTARTVLLKGLDHGFLFATNYLSRKGHAIDADANVTAVFGWYKMHRQVIVEGAAAKVTADESTEYFATRPRGSQVAAWASEQSRPIESRDALEQQFEDAEQRFAGDGDVPRPPHWGGYRITPTRIEFWKGRSNRMHDRIVYLRTADGWTVERLQP
ncbi:MAG: pyridoxine/pyridoxamine 5-phosphate oxidase [Actinomycetota bacterium]|jgi:pyridoxamine 5'-phosphate oxidase